MIWYIPLLFHSSKKCDKSYSSFCWGPLTTNPGPQFENHFSGVKICPCLWITTLKNWLQILHAQWNVAVVCHQNCRRKLKTFSVKPIYPKSFTFSRAASSFAHHRFSPSTSWQLWNVMESLLRRRKESCHPRKTNYTILPPYLTAPSPVWLCSNSQIYEFHIPLRKYMALVEQGHDKRVLINIWMKNHLASF